MCPSPSAPPLHTLGPSTRQPPPRQDFPIATPIHPMLYQHNVQPITTTTISTLQNHQLHQLPPPSSSVSEPDSRGSNTRNIMHQAKQRRYNSSQNVAMAKKPTGDHHQNLQQQHQNGGRFSPGRINNHTPFNANSNNTSSNNSMQGGRPNKKRKPYGIVTSHHNAGNNNNNNMQHGAGNSGKRQQEYAGR